MHHVAICIASYRRPQGLAALLDAIAGQACAGAPAHVRVVVADNDAAGSAREVACAPRPGLAQPVEYVVEPRRGIAQARNAALERALPGADALAFVDDDSVPDPGWLAALLAALERHGADVATGPVLPRFERTPPGWVVEGGFFASPRHPDGADLASASTNNALVRAACLRDDGVRFDERFPWMGEDTELFERLAASGRRIVWADDALVHDTVPAQRTTLPWIVSRAFRNGRARTRIDRLHHPHGAPARALGEGLRSLARGAWGALGSRRAAQRVEGLRIAAYAAGRAGGLVAR